MKTAKSRGFQIGDFVDTGFFPGIIIGDLNSETPSVEAWGVEHEMGSAYAEDLSPLSWKTFEAVASRYGFDGTAYSEAAKEAIANAKRGKGAAVTA